jgi:glyoxylase-like metal-dependent hydrolase (beta-lactamase superfamily II)
MGLVLKQFEIGPMQNFGYLIGDEKTKQAFIVDPAWDPAEIAKKVLSEGFILAGLIITHAHYDHVNAIEALLQKFDVPVYANKAEISYAKSGNTIVGELGSTVKAVEGGETVHLGETAVTFLHTPGHTPGSQCVRVGNHFLTGDTLFIGGCGRTDLPGGNPKELFRSLQKISQLPANLEVCPGHDYGEKPRRILKEEMALNPYFKIGDEVSFVDAVG